MSEKYLPLFRKYRPQSFKDVVGQESLVKALSNAIELNRIANAYLFAGPRGTGKTSCARIFAKSLNCTNGPTLEPCQKCPSCLDITNASGLDVIEIDAATNRGIDDAKDLIAQTQYAPMNGKYKIFIIDEVHMLSNEAFNALLKTFEEPPNNVIFILATTEPHKVIETIVSRCQRFDLRRITTDDITKRLREISDIENIKITDDALYTIAKNVSGGLRDSLALLDQVSILGARETISKEDIENLLGKVTFDVAFDFLNKILLNDVTTALSALDEIYNKGLEPKNFCENFIEFLRNLIFALKSDDVSSTLKFTNFNQGDIEKINSEFINTENFDTGRIFRILEKVIEYYKEIRFATNPYLWAELMVINLCKTDTVSQVIPVQETVMQNVSVSAIAPTVSQTVSHTVLQNSAQQIKDSSIILPAESIVKETLKEIEIPVQNMQALPNKQEEKEKEQGPQNSREYKEELYEKAEAKESEIKMPAVQTSGMSAPVHSAAPKTPNQASSSASDVSDPAAAWTNVLNVIESIPAKFFYSGVGKLVGVQNNKITLGFVNENAINQAKSESKFKHLTKAINTVLGENWVAEFILITENIQTLDVKLKPQAPARPNYPQAQNDVQNNVSKPEFEHMPKKKQEDVPVKPQVMENEVPMPNVNTDFEASDAEKTSAMNNYGRKTKEMLREFNGRVID